MIARNLITASTTNTNKFFLEMLLFALKMLYSLLGDPHNDANAVGTDAFKTLFIGRIVCIHHCLSNADAAKESGHIQCY